MSKFFAVIGMAAVVVILLGIAAFGYVAYRGNALDEEASAYSARAVTAITSHWDAAELMSRATPQLAHATSQDQLGALFQRFGTLGPLRGAPHCQGSSLVSMTPAGTRTSGSYTCTAQFQSGPAEIAMALVKAHGTWLINGFHVTSQLLGSDKLLQKA